MNAFMGNVLSFYQYKTQDLSQMFHTGPFKPKCSGNWHFGMSQRSVTTPPSEAVIKHVED